MAPRPVPPVVAEAVPGPVVRAAGELPVSHGAAPRAVAEAVPSMAPLAAVPQEAAGEVAVRAPDLPDPVARAAPPMRLAWARMERAAGLVEALPFPPAAPPAVAEPGEVPAPAAAPILAMAEAPGVAPSVAPLVAEPARASAPPSWSAAPVAAVPRPAAAPQASAPRGFDDEAAGGAPQVMEGRLEIDGAALGRWIAEHLAREAGRPPAGMTGVDPRLALPWAGAMQG
jgi:hypothetical protein